MFPGDFLGTSMFWYVHQMDAQWMPIAMRVMSYVCVSLYNSQGTDIFSFHLGKPRIDIIPYYAETVGKFDNFSIF